MTEGVALQFSPNRRLLMASNALWVVAACLDEIENGVVNSSAKAEFIGME